MNFWFAIPTYWTAAGPETTVFDHPTPLNQEGSLPRLLESFRRVKGDFKVIIVAAGVHPSIGKAVHDKVASLLKPFSGKMTIYLASPANLDAINSVLPGPLLKLDSYGNIRNVQLIVPFMAGADAVAGIDDDEVMIRPDYLDLAEKALQGADGLAGPYFDAGGEYRIKGAEALEAQPNIFLKKNYFMNEALKKAMAGKGARTSNVAFGGNMVIPRKTIAQVCHDPYIPRGEDYDYVVNAAMRGLFFKFVPGMGVTHLPPDSDGSQAADKSSKLAADVRRFIYMNEKMALHCARFPHEAFDKAYLEPYPGPYLKPSLDLTSAGAEALHSRYPEEYSAKAAEIWAQEASALARAKAVEFFEYRERWTAALAAEPMMDIEALRVKP